MRSLLLVIIHLLFLGGVEAQDYVTKKTASSKALKAFEKGREYVNANDLGKAAFEFEKAIKAQANFVDAHLFWADVQKEKGNFDQAEKGFLKVIELAPDYKPKVFYALGMMQLRRQHYDKAAGNLATYLTKPIRTESFRKKVELYLANAKFGAVAIKNPVPFDAKNMGTAVNSSDMEYWPSISVDGETFVFTRQIKGNEDFWVSVKKEGEWQPAVNMGKPINTPSNEGDQTLSADGRDLAFTVCNRAGDLGKCDIYLSEKKGGNWTKPKNIGAPINSAAWESQPSLSADGSSLFFIRADDGRAPDSDIYESKRQSNGKWSTPKKLGTQVNTIYAEEAPFLHPDGQTLYFVSNGHPGMGGSDFYLSRKQADGSWGEAINLGHPINTAGKEFSIIVSFDGETGYFSSDKEGGKGTLDIYSFPMPKAIRPQPATYVKAMVYDVETKKRLVANVEFNELASGLTHAKSITNEQGEFLICLPLGKDYALNVAKKKYLFHSENFALKDNASRDEPYILEIGLQPFREKVVAAPSPTTTTPVVKSKPIVLKNVFFETASAELLDVSITELNKLRDLLVDNPSMRIRLNGHTDNVGSDMDNQDLSTRRAKAVMDYLIKQGIEASRLNYKGFGEHKPIDTNETKEGRANNRRTEFEIL